MRRIYTSIDLGSDTIKAIVCELFNGKLHLLASSIVKSEGIRKGVIVDLDMAVNSVSKAINGLEVELGVRIKRVLVNVPSYFANFEVVRGDTLIGNQNVNGNTIVKVLQSSVKGHIEMDREMLTIVPIDFSIDNNPSVIDPNGLSGRILATRAVLVTVPKKNIFSVINLFNHLNIEVTDVSINEIGDMYAFKNDKIGQSIGAIINIGHNITTISIFNKGIIVKNSILQMGGVNISNDLSYIFKLDQSEAYKIKEKFAFACRDYASSNDVLDISTSSGSVKVNQAEISDVVQSRIEEILSLVKKEISSLTNKELSYIMVTGGITNLNYFGVVAKNILGDMTTIGNVKLLGIRNNKYSSVVGNMIYYINKLKLKGEDSTMINEEDELVLSSPKKNTSETMISKVFNFFTNE